MDTLFEDRAADIENLRRPECYLDPMFLHRWSPRAFDPEPIPQHILDTLFEAARWAPSCYNEQPWVFLYASSKEDLPLYLDLLVETNRVWARSAPVLAFAFARRHFRHTGDPNRWAAFDCGAAWMSLTLQARMLGLYTHGMAGFHRDRVYGALGVPEADYEVICAIALGRYGDPETLPPEKRQIERPNDRKPLSEVAVRGKWR
jgi:nitroreductase